MESYTNPEYTTDVAVTVGKVSATFKVEVLAGEEHRDGAGVEILPALRVTTHLATDNAYVIMIRKRGYTVDTTFVPAPMYGPGGERTGVWWKSSKHHDYGVRTASGDMVENSTATRKQLNELAAAARDAYMAAHPGWELVSRQRRLGKLISRARGLAEDARRMAAEHDDEAAKLQAELDALGPRPHQRGVSTAEAASKLRTGDRAHVSGVDADGAPRQATGYVLIADKMASGGYAVTVTQHADGTGPLGETVYVR